MGIVDKIAEYNTLLATKESLSEQTKNNNKAIEAMKKEIADLMIDEEVPSIGYGDYTFSLQEKTVYNKKSEQEMQANGIDFFETLRNQGLGDLIVETVNAKTLSSAVKAIVDETGELPEELSEVVNPYSFFNISRRKNPNKALRNAKGGK